MQESGDQGAGSNWQTEPGNGSVHGCLMISQSSSVKKRKIVTKELFGREFDELTELVEIFLKQSEIVGQMISTLKKLSAKRHQINATEMTRI